MSYWNILSLTILPLQTIQIGLDFPSWAAIMEKVLNGLYGFAVRGYLLLILLGFIIFMTALNDGLAKALIASGVGIYIGGPYFISICARLANVENPTIETATSAWVNMFGMFDSEMVAVIVFLGDILFSICMLSGVILYLTPSSNDLKAKGHSLIVRSLMLAPVLIFFNVTPWI